MTEPEAEWPNVTDEDVRGFGALGDFELDRKLLVNVRRFSKPAPDVLAALRKVGVYSSNTVEPHIECGANECFRCKPMKHHYFNVACRVQWLQACACKIVRKGMHWTPRWREPQPAAEGTLDRRLYEYKLQSYRSHVDRALGDLRELIERDGYTDDEALTRWTVLNIVCNGESAQLRNLQALLNVQYKKARGVDPLGRRTEFQLLISALQRVLRRPLLSIGWAETKKGSEWWHVTFDSLAVNFANDEQRRAFAVVFANELSYRIQSGALAKDRKLFPNGLEYDNPRYAPRGRVLATIERVDKKLREGCEDLHVLLEDALVGLGASRKVAHSIPQFQERRAHRAAVAKHRRQAARAAARTRGFPPPVKTK